jgi:ABC-type transporter Mla MlaB component
LMGWQRHAVAQGKKLHLVSVPSNLASIMQLTGADAMFDMQHA